MADNEGPVRPGGSSAVQGCLIGAVLLFVLLLGAMVFLAYARMRDRTAPEAEQTAAIWMPPAAFATNGATDVSSAEILAGRDDSHHRSVPATNG